MGPLFGVTSVITPPKIQSDSWKDITPIYSTARDIKTFADNPTFFNAAMAAWGGRLTHCC